MTQQDSPSRQVQPGTKRGEATAGVTVDARTQTTEIDKPLSTVSIKIRIDATRDREDWGQGES